MQVCIGYSTALKPVKNSASLLHAQRPGHGGGSEFLLGPLGVDLGLFLKGGSVLELNLKVDLGLALTAALFLGLVLTAVIFDALDLAPGLALMAAMFDADTGLGSSAGLL